MPQAEYIPADRAVDRGNALGRAGRIYQRNPKLVAAKEQTGLDLAGTVARI